MTEQARTTKAGTSKPRGKAAGSKQATQTAAKPRASKTATAKAAAASKARPTKTSTAKAGAAKVSAAKARSTKTSTSKAGASRVAAARAAVAATPAHTAHTVASEPAQSVFGRSHVPVGIRAASEWAARFIVIGVAIFAGAKILGVLSTVVIPILVALLLAALLSPIYQRLAKLVSAGPAAGITVVGTLAVLVGLFTLVGNQIATQIPAMTKQVGTGIEQMRSWIQGTLNISDSQLTEYINQARDEISKAGNASQLAAAGSTASHLVAGFFISLFALFFFLYDGKTIWAWIVRLFPRSAEPHVASSGIIAWRQLTAFTRATVIVAAVDAIGIALGAFAIGVPFVSGIALLVFVGAFVPVVGALLSGFVAVALALVAKGPIAALLMLAVVIGVQQLESHVLQPFLLGRAVRVHPLAVILAIAAGIVLGGIIGALIAVPTLAIANAVALHLRQELDPPQESLEQFADEITDPRIDPVMPAQAE